jgi:hypothetical protein
MKFTVVCFGLFLAGGCLIGPGSLGAAPATADCEDHLKLIHQAIQQHRRDHKELPKRLSDLVPAYFTDPNILYCPNPISTGTSAARVGKTTADLDTSYYYEFSLAPSSVPGRTERDRKSAQMSLIGSEVPIVRCFLHEPDLKSGRKILNLSFGGEVYKSQLVWENNYTNLVHRSDLSFPPLLRNTAVRVVQIHPRPVSAHPNQVDLSEFYNASLSKPWLSDPEHHLAPFASEKKALHPVAFDARGVIQLAGQTIGISTFPDEIKGLSIDSTCRNLHFLNGSAGAALPGTAVGHYVVHYQDRQVHQIPIVYGDHLLDAWNVSQGPVTNAQPAWETVIEKNGAANRAVRLYRLTWENPRPNIRITAVDFISSKSTAAPYLLAITAED